MTQFPNPLHFYNFLQNLLWKVYFPPGEQYGIVIYELNKSIQWNGTHSSYRSLPTANS